VLEAHKTLRFYAVIVDQKDIHTGSSGLIQNERAL